MNMPEVGQKAPSFSLPDQSGNIHSLDEARGGWVLVYFYPKDDTPGCTKEACSIRDAWGDFKKAGITVFGISADTVKSHARFAEKYNLPFTLLADEGREVVSAYGVWGKKKFMGREYEGVNRTSFLINSSGVIAKIYKNVKPNEHAQEVLDDVSAMR